MGSKVTGVKIKGIGKYVPEMVATNEDFTKIVETSDEWITQRTGIKQTHHKWRAYILSWSNGGKGCNG